MDIGPVDSGSQERVDLMIGIRGLSSNRTASDVKEPSGPVLSSLAVLMRVVAGWLIGGPGSNRGRSNEPCVTNVGIKRVADGGRHGETEAALRATRHLFVNRDNPRKTIATLVNATLKMRDPLWWGNGTHHRVTSS
jgi:hypothetical protein